MFCFTSPSLTESERAVKECPVGKILRETPYIYEAISAHGYAETGALNPLETTTWLRDCFRVISSERERLRIMREEIRKTKADSKYGMRVRRG